MILRVALIASALLALGMMGCAAPHPITQAGLQYARPAKCIQVTGSHLCSRIVRPQSGKPSAVAAPVSGRVKGARR